MELTLIYTIVGFGLAGWSVIANDSIQTLGTFIASKQKWFKWYTLASAASIAMIVTVILQEPQRGTIEFLDKEFVLIFRMKYLHHKSTNHNLL